MADEVLVLQYVRDVYPSQAQADLGRGLLGQSGILAVASPVLHRLPEILQGSAAVAMGNGVLGRQDQTLQMDV